MFSLRYFLLPFSWIFGLVVWVRNEFYDKGWLKSKDYQKAIICIGNIRVGGTGKTPFTEYLIKKLTFRFHIGILSRGYGRKTKGLREVEYPNSQLFGDEPSQFKAKFPDLKVVVSEKRSLGIDYLMPLTDIILMDDAYQHRKVKAGMNWVLLEYKDLHSPFFLLPSGNYREGKSGLKRAEAVLITKCPESPSQEEIRDIRNRLSLSDDQMLFFSSIRYLPLVRLEISNEKDKREEMISSEVMRPIQTKKPVLEDFDFMLVFTGIGNDKPIRDFLEGQKARKEFISYPDHHNFTAMDINQIVRKFRDGEGNSKILLTTEKDAQRLGQPEFALFIHEYPVYFQPIEFSIQNQDESRLIDFILHYVESTI